MPTPNTKPEIPIPCIFCANNAGSEEHLWPAWMHRLVKFAPLNIREGSRPILMGQDPQVTINTVCRACNNGWMSNLEQKNVSRLKPMLLNTPIKIDAGGIKLLIQWAVKTAMISDSIKPRNDNDNFYLREERVAMRVGQIIPARTRVWIGSLTGSHIGCHGVDFTIMADGGKTRIGTGSAHTIYAGHFVIQIVTEHIHPPFPSDQIAPIGPLPSICDGRFIEIHPNSMKSVDWPPKPFTDSEVLDSGSLLDRWRQGSKTDKIKNVT